MKGYVRGTLAFSSLIERSKWFADTLPNNTLKGQITRRLAVRPSGSKN